MIAQAVIESLETRRLLAAITVTTTADDLTADDGSVSLREAITAINAGNALGDPDITAQSPGTFGTSDQIGFNIGGGGAQTISPTGPLPGIAKAVNLDATTQPGFAGSPLITLDGSGAGVVDAGLQVFAPATTIRGFTVQNFHGDNLTNLGVGIFMQNSSGGAPGLVAGNIVVGNTQGIYSGGLDGCVVGGITPADRNVASGNTFSGIQVNSDPTGLTRIQGNYVGVDVDGVTPLPNGSDGIANQGAGSNDGSFLVGGSIPEAANIIAFNHGNGVSFLEGAVVRLNSIYSNDGLGIDNTRFAGTNPNDPGDTDQLDFGPPNYEIVSTLQNHPVLSSATRSGGNVTVSGLLNSNANSPFLVDFYASPLPDPSGYGEGKTYLGSVSVITDNSGNATLNPTFAAAAGVGDYITATATSVADGFHSETSEFSNAVHAVAPAPQPAPVAVGYNNLKATRTKAGKYAFTGVVASFTSAAFNTANSFSATINWGDGSSSAGQIVWNSNTNRWDVVGTHQYAKKGKFSLLITITDTNGKTANANSQLTAA